MVNCSAVLDSSVLPIVYSSLLVAIWVTIASSLDVIRLSLVIDFDPTEVIGVSIAFVSLLLKY